MANFNAKEYSTLELLKCFASLLDELKSRKVIRNRNNPVSDYAEWLVTKKLDLMLEPNNNQGYDAKGKDDKRYQIKARRLERTNSSRQLGVIRNLDGNEFDYLAGILFDNDFEIKEAYLIPHQAISEFGRFSTHQNGYILQLRGNLLNSQGVQDITHVLNR